MLEDFEKAARSRERTQRPRWPDPQRPLPDWSTGDFAQQGPRRPSRRSSSDHACPARPSCGNPGTTKAPSSLVSSEPAIFLCGGPILAGSGDSVHGTRVLPEWYLGSTNVLWSLGRALPRELLSETGRATSWAWSSIWWGCLRPWPRAARGLAYTAPHTRRWGQPRCISGRPRWCPAGGQESPCHPPASTPSLRPTRPPADT